MDVPEERYRKAMTTYRQPLHNLLYEYPISETDLPSYRNLKYLVQKESIPPNLSHDDEQYEGVFEDIKQFITHNSLQERMLSIRLARALPFNYRIRVIEQLQNEILKLVIVSSGTTTITGSPTKSKEKAPIVIRQNNFEFLYEILSDVSDLLLSVYQLTHLSEDIYFDVNQRILSVLGRIVENGFSAEDRDLLRCSFEVIRSVFLMFGPNKLNDQIEGSNKLINRFLNYFSPNNSFMSKGVNLGSAQKEQNNNVFMPQKSYSNKLYHLILRGRQFEARIRSRFLYGLCCLCTYRQQPTETIELLLKETFTIMENANECDVNLECFNSVKAVLQIQELSFHIKNGLMKKWTKFLIETSYKKEYLEYFVALLSEASSPKNSCPLKVKFFIGMSFLEMTKNIQQEYSRFIIYKLACRNIMQASQTANLHCKGENSMTILNIFEHRWFLSRVKEDNDLFRSQFLISLIHGFFSVHFSAAQSSTAKHSQSLKSEIKDLLSLCHILLDWRCSSKEDTHIPTIKFAFDMYLGFLQKASEILDDEIEKTIEELIERCNTDPNLYFVFRFKLISAVVGLPWYQSNNKFLSQIKFNFNDLYEEIRLFIMPKKPKQIFDLEYSQSEDGVSESRKQIECVKVIMLLLINLQKVHEEMGAQIEAIMTDYHMFLNNLEGHPNANRDLIYCLQTGTADQYFSVAQRHFLLSLIDQTDANNNNYQLNLDGNIMYSPYEDPSSEDEINIFGPMSPVRLTVKLHAHNSFSSLYLQVKKNNWVGTPKLKLVVSTGMEKKELVFESSILKMKVDRTGNIHFEVWTTEGDQKLIGSGNLKVNRKLKWKRVDHLSVVEGIKRKSYFKVKSEQNSSGIETYLSYFYGEPVLIQIIRNQNEIVVGTSNKDQWLDVQSYLHDMIEEFTKGSAEIIE